MIFVCSFAFLTVSFFSLTVTWDKISGRGSLVGALTSDWGPACWTGARSGRSDAAFISDTFAWWRSVDFSFSWAVKGEEAFVGAILGTPDEYDSILFPLLKLAVAFSAVFSVLALAEVNVISLKAPDAATGITVSVLFSEVELLSWSTSAATAGSFWKKSEL